MIAGQANPVAFTNMVRQSCVMAARIHPARSLRQAFVSILLAAVLVAVATLARYALASQLGLISPFMLYVLAVLIGGLVRGVFCGTIVLLASGVLGYQLFLAPYGASTLGSILSLFLFWGVALPVLATAAELRAQLNGALSRLSEALARNDRP